MMNGFPNRSPHSKVFTPVAVETVLEQLDSCGTLDNFPVLDNPDIDLAATRLHVYRAPTDWALLIEVVGYWLQAQGTDRFRLDWYLFGNCLPFEPGFVGSERIIHNGPGAPIFSTQPPGGVNPHATCLYVRNRLVAIPQNADEYKRQGIYPRLHPFVMGTELLRMLTSKDPDLVFAPVAQHRRFIPNELSWLLSLVNWHHPNIRSGEKPSSNQAFQQLAQVISSGDRTLYQPNVEPNTHWTHWI